MSAWIVTKAHIDCIVQQAIVEGLVSAGEATKVGRELWQENHDSVNYRYSESQPCPAYRFEGIEAPLDPVIVLKQVDCYDYQSCEHPGWDSSEARRLINALRDRLEAKGADWHHLSPAAAWGIDSLLEAVAR